MHGCILSRSSHRHSSVLGLLDKKEARSVDLWHANATFGHSTLLLGCPEATPVHCVQQSILVVTKLSNGILHPRDVEPANDHAEELGEQDAKQQASHYLIVIHEPDEDSISTTSDVDDVLQVQPLFVKDLIST